MNKIFYKTNHNKIIHKIIKNIFKKTINKMIIKFNNKKFKKDKKMNNPYKKIKIN